MSSTQESNPLGTWSESRRSSVSLASATTSIASSSTPAAEPDPEMNPSVFNSQNPNHPLPAYARDHPKPTGELDIEEALNRKPGRWTFRGTVERSLRREPRPSVHEINQEGARAAAYTEAKRELLESATQMKAAQQKQ